MLDTFTARWLQHRLPSSGRIVRSIQGATNFEKEKKKKKKENSLMFLTNDAVSSTYARDENHGTLIGPFPIRYN